MFRRGGQGDGGQGTARRSLQRPSSSLPALFEDVDRVCRKAQFVYVVPHGFQVNVLPAYSLVIETQKISGCQSIHVRLTLRKINCHIQLRGRVIWPGGKNRVQDPDCYIILVLHREALWRVQNVVS